MHHFTSLAETLSAGEVDPSHAIAIKQWARAYLHLDPETVITVSELACSDPGCPLLETAITVFDAPGTRTWKLTRPRMAVTKTMIYQTLATPPEQHA